MSLNTLHLNETGTTAVDAELVDVNGDGLPDIVQSWRCLNTVCMVGSYPGLDTTYVYLNTGNGWVYDNSWSMPADQFSLDYSAMTGVSNPMVSGHNIQVSVNTANRSEPDIFTVDAKLADVNGDGLPDIVQSYRCPLN